MHRVFLKATSPYIAAFIPGKELRLYRHFKERQHRETCFRHPVSRSLIFEDILHTAE